MSAEGVPTIANVDEVPCDTSTSSTSINDVEVAPAVEAVRDIVVDDDKGDVSTETTGPAQAVISVVLQTSAERLAVLLAYP
ncbi:hypothetical protein V6N12_013345 [Hibiscus sabdariffa]|uniref:Uncharacterized protein n=1 Tax=Hibiscus sabdariffa TaxID=183260 RepID=A0ABR2D7X7_9ROSI